jgi:colanic acid/amylovoran biosynthesis glycosyltransferase
MKIAYICSMKRGLPSFVYREIKTLFDRGIKVDIFTTKYKPGLYMPEGNWSCWHYKPLTVILSQPFFLILFLRKYLSLFLEALKTHSVIDFVIAFFYVRKMNNIDRIHCHEAMHPVFIGYYCSKILNVPLSVTIHADTFYVNPNPDFAKHVLSFCHDIITISDYNRNILIRDYGISPEKIQVIRLGVDISKFSKYDRKSILIVGQYAERKGHEDLFKAFKQLGRDDVDLWIAGSGSWGGERDFVDVPALVKKYGLSEHVIFFQSISEKFLQYLYANCTIFCLPSKKSSDGNCEGLPVSLMEAMASYKPVVSTFHTGIPEIVNEILVAEGDYLSLSNALSALLDKTESEIIRIGEVNRKIVEENYSAETNVKILADFFQQI